MFILRDMMQLWTVVLLASLLLGVIPLIKSRKVRTVGRRGRAQRQNVVFVMADDLDVFLNSTSVMRKTERILRDKGVTFTNAFTTSPLCCPSRSSILTGRYAHNHHVNSNNRNCSSDAWIERPEKQTVGKLMQAAGYQTAYFGKYLNNYDGARIPPGWDNWVGLVRNSRFYNYTLNNNGRLKRYGARYEKDYLTNVVVNYSTKYFTERKRKKPDQPIFMIVSMSAPHGPEDAAPQYQDKFPDVKAPRFPNYNKTSLDKHWIIKNTPPLTNATEHFTDVLYRKRLQTLLSLDDAIEKIYNVLVKTNQLHNTYFFFSSDHGYHLGQFNQVKGKAQPYEADIRIPLYMRGPKIPRGVKVDDIALNIDLTPTFLDIANLVRPKFIDGTSLMDIAVGSVINRIKRKVLKPIWKDTFIVERGKLRNSVLHAAKNIRDKRYYSPAIRRVKKTCPRNIASPPCTEGKKQICYVKDDHRYIVQCPSVYQVNPPSVRKVKKACFWKYPRAPCTAQKKFVCHHKYGSWYIKKCPNSEQGITPLCSCHKIDTNASPSAEVTSSSYQMDSLLFQLEKRFERLKRRIKRHGVSYYFHRFRNIVNNDYRYIVLARQKVQSPSNASVEALRNVTSTISTAPSKNESQIQNVANAGRRSNYWNAERRKLSSLRAQSRSYRTNRRTLTAPTRKTKQIPETKNNFTQSCTCVANKRHMRKKLKRKKAGLRGREMNCFQMTKSHWKTPPLWDGPSFTACTNTPNSTYWCLRTINKTHNFLYCEFVTGFKEYFDVNKDPYQLTNIANTLPKYKSLQLHKLLIYLKDCRGSSGCFVKGGQTFFDRKDILRKWRRYERKKRHGIYVRATYRT